MSELTPANAFDSGSLTRKFYERDPFLRLLRDRWRLNLGLAMVAYGLLTALVLIGLGSLLQVGLNPDSLGVSVTQSVVMAPLSVLIYWRLPDMLARLFGSLPANDVIGPGQDERAAYQKFLTDFASTINHRGWVALGVALILLYAGYRFGATVPGDMTGNDVIPNTSAQAGFRLAIVTAYAPLTYMGVLIVARLTCTLLFTERLFHAFTLHVNPLHPDQAGGFGEMGRLLTVSVLMAAGYGAASVSIVLHGLNTQGQPFLRLETLALVMMYVILTPLLFACWLWRPHQTLVATARRELSQLAAEFMHATAESPLKPDDSTEAIKARTDRLMEIKRQYDFLKDIFPAWPIHINLLRSITITSILPLLPSLLPGVSSKFWEALSGLLKTGG